MIALEDLKPGVQVRGILPQHKVSLVGVKWHGSTAVELTYKRPDGQPGTQLLYRSDESTLEIVQTKRTWNFHIGGYQVLHKWLYDRRGKRGQPGRTLTEEDIAHYQRIVVALKETMRLMGEIDEVIEEHGGWPIE